MEIKRIKEDKENNKRNPNYETPDFERANACLLK